MKLKFFLIILFLSILVAVIAEDVSAQKSAFGPEIKGDFYTISRSKIERTVRKGEVFRDLIEITNTGDTQMDVSFSLSEGLSEVIEFESEGLIIGARNISTASLLIKGVELGNYSGSIQLRGGIIESIPVNISVVDDSFNSPVIINIELDKKKFILNQFIEFKLNVNKITSDRIMNSSFSYRLLDENNKSYILGKDEMDVLSSFQVVKRFWFPEGLEVGPYVLEVVFDYDHGEIVNKTQFALKKSFYQIMVFGFIPMWLLILIVVLLISGLLIFFLVRRSIQKKKKYKMRLDEKTIPKKNPDFLFLGKIAETNIPAYLDPARLTTHTIVAGATGGGKSISAQVIIEEALLHNISVLVFDPTAQWSGMLRKCTDKKMMSYYPKFGLKEADSKAFKGNVRQVKNARELIDITKYINPGQIQIFSLNKLKPQDMDIFVANVIRQVFKSDPKESPTLKVILVFDEVHRLLSKFGGSGEGFLQVERACREFRKWGLGVMLVSQVLSDFVGEIKANISTEVQMRTRDEGDLNRIKTKYGEEVLQSLVKASVGVGMFVNPAYNHAKPYFINFRPILHNTRRLPDEELERYNKYNDMVDDVEYQIEQLEKEKVDTFDLKMELKLVKDKIMTGSFSVVEIYLEGLKPRVDKEWDKLGKKPKKREVKLVSEEEIQKSIQEAKNARAKVEAADAKKQKAEEEKNKVEKKEDLTVKELAPLTFDNGIMVSSLKELLGVLPNMDDEIFKTHVNDQKNDIATWIGDNLDKAKGDKLKGITDKAALVAEVKKIGSGGSDDKAGKKTDSKPEGDGEKTKKPEEGSKPAENKESNKEDKPDAKKQ